MHFGNRWFSGQIFKGREDYEIIRRRGGRGEN